MVVEEGEGEEEWRRWKVEELHMQLAFCSILSDSSLSWWRGGTGGKGDMPTIVRDLNFDKILKRHFHKDQSMQ